SMATTFEVFEGAQRRNYSTLPTVDVEILPDIRHCEECGAEVRYVPDTLIGSWQHADGSTDHFVLPKVRCPYCNSEDDAVYKQHAWYDAVECSRCGGVYGRAVGD